MKFAVIEYSSKSGGIWRHTDAKPNYLADPDEEIDATSFGCYVSALQGEHIPITWLANASGSWLRKVWKRIVGSWPSYSIKYLSKFDVLMIVHQVNDAHEIVRLISRIKLQYPHIFVIGVPTWPFGQLIEHFNKNQIDLAIFQEYMDSCHIFVSVVKETLGWYRERTKTPVVYLPQIYPVEYTKQFYRPSEGREKIIFVAGVTTRPNIRQGQAIARQLQREFPEYIIHVTETPGTDLNLTELKGARYEIKPFSQWREHLQYLNTVTLVINTDYTSTRGRVQVDCAAVGTPSLGGNSDGERDLFSGLASTPDTPDDDILAHARRLLTNAAYYDEITTAARQRLQKYSYIESADRLRLLVKMYAK